jgi:hypothetical protein
MIAMFINCGLCHVLSGAACAAAYDIPEDTIAALLLLPLVQQRIDAAAAAFEAERISRLQQELLESWGVRTGPAACFSLLLCCANLVQT